MDFRKKLCNTLFENDIIPDNINEFPISKVVFFSPDQLQILEHKMNIHNIEDLANIWSNFSVKGAAFDNELLENLEKASAAAKLLIRSIDDKFSVSDSVKVVLVGLDNAGKSSIVSILKKGKRLLEIRLLINKLMPTAGETKERLDVAGIPINMHELGGQEDYRNLYLEKPGEYFLNSHALIFVIDIQDSSRFLLSKKYLEKIRDLLSFLDIYLPIYCFLHKNDPDKVDQIEIDKIRIELESISNFIFLTSIYEPSTIANAFTLILQNTLPVTHWLNEGLTRLAIEELKTPYLSIIDKGIVLGEYSAFMFSSSVKIREKIQNELYNRNTEKPFFLIVEKFSIDPKKSLFLVLSDITINNLKLIFAALTLNQEEGAKFNRINLSEKITRRVGTEIKFLSITRSAMSKDPSFRSEITDTKWRNQD